MASAYFLEGLKRPNAAMAIIAAANVVNLVLNWALIYGHFGLAPGGAVGSAWATTGVRVFMAAIIVAYIWTLADHERLGVRKKAHVFFGGGWKAWAQQRRIGYSAGMSAGVESMAFSLLTIIAGLVGTVALAAYSIAFQTLGVIFMIALGFGSATSVLVGHAWGRRDLAEMTRAGWLGVGTDLAIVTVAAVAIVVFAESIAGVYTSDPALIAATVPLIVLMAFVIVPDHGQAVMAHALRGRGDTWIPVSTHLISYFGVMAPLSWVLALTLERGTRGIMEAMLVASVLAAMFLFARFYVLSKRPPA
jgi:MATE family multidrug resistance protein